VGGRAAARAGPGGPPCVGVLWPPPRAAAAQARCPLRNRPPCRALRCGVRSGGRRVVDLPAVAVSSLVEIAGRLGQAGSELGGYVGGGVHYLPAVAASSLVEIGGRLGQAGSELGGYVGGAVQQIAQFVPVPFHAAEEVGVRAAASRECGRAGGCARCGGGWAQEDRAGKGRRQRVP
jgi:hypothetical protein